MCGVISPDMPTNYAWDLFIAATGPSQHILNDPGLGIPGLV